MKTKCRNVCAYTCIRLDKCSHIQRKRSDREMKKQNRVNGYEQSIERKGWQNWEKSQCFKSQMTRIQCDLLMNAVNQLDLN